MTAPQLFLQTVPYFAVFATLAALIYPYRHLGEMGRRVILYVCLVGFILFFGLHGDVGQDYSNYARWYSELSFNHLETITLYEPAFTLMGLCFKFLHLPFQSVIFACSCLMNVLFFRFFSRQRGNVPFMLCVFFAISGIANEINFIRSSISMAIFVNSLEYMVERNTKRFYLLNAFGLLFHYSSILYMLLYHCLTKRIPRIAVLCTGIICTGLALFHFQFLTPLANLLDATDSRYFHHCARYLKSVYAERHIDFTISFVERFMTGFAIPYYYKSFTQKPMGRIAVNSFMLYYTAYTLLSGYGILGSRLGNMFVYSYWLLWPAIIRQIQGLKTKRLVVFAMCIYMVLRLLNVGLLPIWHYTLCFSL